MTARFTLGILEAGRNRSELIPEHGDYSDWFERSLSLGSDVEFEFRRYPAYHGVLPKSEGECDGYLMTGSRASVREPEAWMSDAKRFMVAASAHRPVIGICFGHQLIAEAFGGRVERAPSGWNVGAHPYEVMVSKPWMTPPSTRVSILSSNVDQVTAPPEAAEVLARSETCPVAMMQIGERVLTVQPHPEATKPLMEIIYRLRKEQIGPQVTDTALRSLANSLDGDLVIGWITGFLMRAVVAA